MTPTLGLAVGTAALTGDFNRFLSLVIVDYGTGIRVAAPTAVLASMTHAARAGIIIKSGAHMERLADVDTMIFDKTGTLTHGSPAVLDVISYERGITDRHLLGLAAAAETRLKHPVAEALRVKAREIGANVPDCEETKYRIGLGVEGQVNGYYLHVGNERLMRQSEINIRAAEADRAALDSQGYSCIYVAVDGTLAGLVPFTDQIRPESREIIQRLHAMGIRNSVMLTGDNAVVARSVGRQLGLSHQFADMLPADKAEVIQQYQRQGHVVAMVGDGINDSPALSFADVGIAMKHGAEVARESADVVLMEDLLWKLVKAVEISRGAVSLIRQNYAIVAGLNTLALGLALPGGLISPEITALISNGSAIFCEPERNPPDRTIPMIKAEPTITLPPSQQQALQRAVMNLENKDFAARLADYAGRPISRALRLMPKAAADGINRVAERAILNSLNIAIRSIEPNSKRRPAQRAASVLAGLSGGVSGFFGIAALPIELPVTTTLMLRAIADIARHHGEDLSTLEARLACVEVFALGAPEIGRRTDFGYYASRALIGRLAADATGLFLERGVANLSAPVVGSLVTEIATRFGVVVTERSAASALPVLGAVGGATVNVIFMNHFQRVARGHFAIRRLERQYGPNVVRQLYNAHATGRRAAR